MKVTRAIAALVLLSLAVVPGVGSTHPAGPAACTGVAPAESSCTTGNDHFVNVHDISNLVFVYPQFGDFRGRIRGVLSGVNNNASVILHCDYVGDAVTDFVADNTGTACVTETSNWPTETQRFKYECFASALNSNTGNARGRFFCGVNHT